MSGYRLQYGYGRSRKSTGSFRLLRTFPGGFLCSSHLGNREMGAATEEIVRKYGQEIELKVLTDDQAVFVQGESTEILQD